MNKQQLAVVSALVGAGGNLGAVIAGFCFYRPINDPLIPFQVHAGYVMFWALLTPLLLLEGARRHVQRPSCDS